MARKLLETRANTQKTHRDISKSQQEQVLEPAYLTLTTRLSLVRLICDSPKQLFLAIAISEMMEGTLDPDDSWVFPKITRNHLLC